MKKGKKKWIVLGVIIVLALIATIKSKVTKNAEYKDFTWPDTTLAKMLPDPESKWGRVSSDSATYLSVDIAKVDSKKFESYYKECAKNGFDVDYSSSDTYYYADNSEGYELSISYDKDDKTMRITINAPRDENDQDNTEPTDTDTDDTNTENPTETVDDTSEQTADDGSVRPEVKEALDSYEAFMNEYVDFMNKYNNSDDTVSLLADYTKYMKKYSEMTQKMDEIEEMDLNDAENMYFLEVQTRINTKLAEIQ